MDQPKQVKQGKGAYFYNGGWEGVSRPHRSIKVSLLHRCVLSLTLSVPGAYIFVFSLSAGHDDDCQAQLLDWARSRS